MRKFLLIVIWSIILTVTVSACPLPGYFKTHDEPSVTLKVMTIHQRSFKFESILSEKFPSIQFQFVHVIPPSYSADQRSFYDDPERIKNMIVEEKADLYYNFEPHLFTDKINYVNLAPLIQNEGMELNAIQSGMYDLSQKVESVSPTFDCDVLFVNKQELREHGIEWPTGGPVTWERFRDIAAMWRAYNPGQVAYQLTYSYWDDLLQSTGAMLGLSIRDKDGDSTLHEPIWRELASQLLQDKRDGLFKKRNDGAQHSWNRVPLHIASASASSDLLSAKTSGSSWTMMKAPVLSGKQAGCYPAAETFSIDRESDQIEEAWKVISYLLSEEAAPKIAGTMGIEGFVPYLEYEKESLGGLSLDALMPPFVTVNKPPAEQNDLQTANSQEQNELNDTIATQLLAVENGKTHLDNAWAVIEKEAKRLNQAN
ncbi:hypothetical protein ACFQZE_09240 [Paenibacillus sp. GCM10027627]|uniref:hypothetical protein n=1 Tax=unclassified Paenibacillus TaxID=185978 RepID=UPI003643AE34